MFKNIINTFGHRLPIYNRFIGGSNIYQVNNTIESLKDINFLPILDFALEHDNKNSDRVFNEVINGLKYNKPIYYAVKLTSLNCFNNNLKYIDNICKLASNTNSSILIDDEQSIYQDKIDEITDIMIEKYNKERPTVYKTYQMYRKDRLETLETDLCKFSNLKLGIKLVRGAYLNEEKKINQELFHSRIEETHDAYNKSIKKLVTNNSDFKAIIATHNKESCNLLMDLLNEKDSIKIKTKFSSAQLLGMSDDLSSKLSKEITVYKYIPYGPFLETVPYLIRRLYENNSILKHSM